MLYFFYYLLTDFDCFDILKTVLYNRLYIRTSFVKVIMAIVNLLEVVNH